MPNLPITGLPLDTELESTDVLPVVDSTNVTKKMVAGSGLGLITSVTPTITVGGFVAGVPVTNQRNDQMWAKLLAPYQAPAFTSFSLQNQTVREVGNALITTENFIWTFSNGQNVADNTIEIYDMVIPQQLIAAHSKTSPASFNFSTLNGGAGIVRNTAGTYQFKINATNTQGAGLTRNFDQNWYWRKFWGTSASAILTEAQIEVLTSQNLSNVTAANYSFAAVAGQYKYFVFQKDLPQPNYLIDFKDQLTGSNVAMEAPYLVTITNSFGVTTDYYVYRTTNQLGGAMTIIVSN